MKNWEFYEEELKKYGCAFAMINNQLVECFGAPCNKCAFDPDIKKSCSSAKMEWLYQEHKEPVVLTNGEQALCRLLGRGWIARDKDNNLYWYETKPKKKNLSAWLASSKMCIEMVFPQCKFEFIEWEDEEPWEVKVDD